MLSPYVNIKVSNPKPVVAFLCVSTDDEMIQSNMIPPMVRNYLNTF